MTLTRSTATRPKPPRIAVGAMYTETSQFLRTRMDLNHWKTGTFAFDREVLELLDTDTEVGGMLRTCRSNGYEAVPLLAARCVPGGPNTTEAYEFLRSALLERVASAGRIDGILLGLHGSMTAESEDDVEGDLLEAIRTIVGPALPIVATLDLHANVTPRMVQHATALVAFSHYPHDDVAETGCRAARLLAKILAGQVRPTMAAATVPVLTSGVLGGTSGNGPIARLARRARRLEREPGVLSVSVLHCHPYNDLPTMGSGGLVVTDDNLELAIIEARRIAAEYWRTRWELEPEILPVRDAVDRGRRIEGGPILLVDTADCAGGGAPGDSVALLRELLDSGGNDTAVVTVVDPEVARRSTLAGPGRTIDCQLGYGIDPSWGRPLEVRATILRVGQGRFTYKGGVFGGTEASMGAIAVLQVGSVQVLVTSQPTYEWFDEQYACAGIDVRTAKFVGVKNPMNYQMAFHGIARGSFIVDTPGPTPATCRLLPYKRVRRPFFPFDPDIPGLEPTVFAGRAPV